MTPLQTLWWTQAKSDYEVFLHLAGQSQFPSCHQLHYLQMTCEKIAKAYTAAHGNPRPQHVVFAQFLSVLAAILGSRKQAAVTAAFGFQQYSAFVGNVVSLLPIAHEIDSLSPKGAGPNPNTEYSWPTNNPTQAPANYSFPIESKLATPSPSISMLQFVDNAVRNFPQYA